MSENEIMKVEIPVEEVSQPDETGGAVVEELRSLGRQLGETFRAAWASEERQRIEAEIREGIQIFVSEVDKAFGEVRQSEVPHRVREEAGQLADSLKSGELPQKARSGMVEGLRRLSDELRKLADSFTPRSREKSPDDVDPTTE